VSLLEEAWWSPRPGPGARLLGLPLGLAALPFGLAAGLRRLAYDRGWLATARAAAPVISVGNLAVGGAGKTPVTLAIAARLAARGRVPAVLSRGYGATRGDARVVSDGRAVRLSAAEGGDDAN
jgi:tetraacyldisaccharide 4'-kinase